MQEKKDSSKCFHCEICNAVLPCAHEHWCGIACENCHCDQCDSAGQKE